MRISDWSSDVCSSDHQAGGGVVQVRRTHQRSDALVAAHVLEVFRVDAIAIHFQALEGETQHLGIADHPVVGHAFAERSAERRVEKECVSTCRSRWSPYH